MHLRLHLTPAFLALLALACGDRATLSLLPATASGRIEAAVELPRAARLDLAWEAPAGEASQGAAAVEVWVQGDGEKGELVQAVPFDAAASRGSASVDLSAWAGETLLLRVTAGAVPVQWNRADLSGRGGGPDSWRLVSPRGAPNVVLYLIDTLRPDVLGAYGGPGPTPTLDRLASEGLTFERAYSTTSWTRPAVASLFTSLPVSAHRVESEAFSLPEGVLTLAERFRLRGYQTMGVVANSHVLSVFNFDQGFEVYDWPPLDSPAGPSFDPALKIRNVPAAAVHALALRHLAALRDPRRPLFLYVHTVDPHNPYHPPQWLLEEERPAVNANDYLLRYVNEGEGASPQLLRDLTESYRGAVAYADHELGDFLGKLGSRLELSRTLLAVTSDHGEGFFEHHLVGHRHWLYEEMIRIPLILRGPGIPAGHRDVAPASLVDVGPTLLALAGLYGESARFAHGTDLLAPGGPASRAARAVQAEFASGSALVRGEWKLTYHPSYPEAFRFGLFNLREDPAEGTNRIEQERGTARQLETELRGLYSSAKLLAVDPLPVNVSRLDPALIQNLRALGYLK